MEHWYDMFPYFLNVFTWYNLGGMILGIVVGLVIGAIPGLNPPMAIALLIPVTFHTPPETALIILTSVYAAGIYTAVPFPLFFCGLLELQPLLQLQLKDGN